MSKLLAIVKQEDQDFRLECECHSRPVARLYRVQEQGSDAIDLCLTTFLDTEPEPVEAIGEVA